MIKITMGWCTRDEVGGSNYGPYSLKLAREIVKNSQRFESSADRQVLTHSTIVQFGGYEKRSWHTWEFTVDFQEKRIRVHHADYKKMEKQMNKGKRGSKSATKPL